MTTHPALSEKAEAEMLLAKIRSLPLHFNTRHSAKRHEALTEVQQLLEAGRHEDALITADLRLHALSRDVAEPSLRRAERVTEEYREAHGTDSFLTSQLTDLTGAQSLLDRELYFEAWKKAQEIFKAVVAAQYRVPTPAPSILAAVKKDRAEEWKWWMDARKHKDRKRTPKATGRNRRGKVPHRKNR